MINPIDVFGTFASFIDDIPGVYEPQADFENTVTQLAMKTVLIAAVSLFILAILALLFSNRYPKLKLPLFILIVISMAGSTLTLITSTIVLNTRSDSGGPIHWHADFEMWACGNELELRDPTGFLSNKIGTATLHEHNDHRLHLEGVAVEEKVDASLGKFMYVVGGAITDEAMVVPLNEEGNIFENEVDGDGPSDSYANQVTPYIFDDAELGKVAYFQDGQTCGADVADVQVFVYKYDGDSKTYEQFKLSGDEVRDYLFTQDPNVPPGDCMIMEFGPTREKTDKLCEQYGIRDISRCEEFGVQPNQREICELTQVNFSEEMTQPVVESADTETDISDSVVEGSSLDQNTTQPADSPNSDQSDTPVTNPTEGGLQ